MHNATQLGTFTFLEGIILTQGISNAGAHLAFEHFHLPIEGHRVIMLARIEIGTHILEEPRLTKSGTTYHYSIDPITVKGISRLFCCTDVAIANDRDVRTRILLHLANERPVGFTLIHLAACPAMYGQRLDTTILQLFSQFNDDFVLTIPTQTGLHCDRNIDGFNHLTGDV